MSTFGGDAIFGRSVAIDEVPNESEVQVSAFFGATGIYTLWGGGRGRMITVSGLLVGADIPTMVAAERALLSYDDGIGRELVDTVRGITYPVAVFTGGYKRTRPMAPCPGGWAQPYSALFRGNL